MKTLIHTTMSTGPAKKATGQEKSGVTVIGTYSKNKAYRRARAQHLKENNIDATTEHTYSHTPIREFRVRSHVITGAKTNDVYLLVTHHDDSPIPRRTLTAVIESAVAELREAYTA